MKKIISIIFAFLILLSGIHFTVATHFCGGEFAASKISLSGELATCGMESDFYYLLPGVHFENHCCDNQVSVFAVDKNYTSAFSAFVLHPNTILNIFLLPENIAFQSHSLSALFDSDVSPPGTIQNTEVYLAKICVFRI